MALYVDSNIPSLVSQFYFQNATDRINTSIERLSSGSRINSASDDAVGLQLSNRLTIQVVGLNQATQNANDGISLAQIAEGSLGEIEDNFQRIRALAVQGGSTTLSSDDRSALGDELEELLAANSDIADNTAFGTFNLLDGSAPLTGFQIQSGFNGGAQDSVTTGNAKLTALFGQVASDESITAALSLLTDTTASTYGTVGQLATAYVAVGGVSAVSLAVSALFGDITGVSAVSNLGEQGNALLVASSFGKILTDLADSTFDHGAVISEIATQVDYISQILAEASVNTVQNSLWTTDAQTALNEFVTDTLLDTMTALISRVDAQRAKLGAEQNGLSSTIRNNSLTVINVSDARSRIQDTDFAEEITSLTRNQILQQLSTSILAQANQQPNLALNLLSS